MTSPPLLGRAVPAVFMRGGTSKGLLFHVGDLPGREHWDELFLSVMGSPDRAARQLDGMGGGQSSLSKVCIVGPPSRSDAHVDFTFAQVSPSRAMVDYTGNCGNMSAAVGPFAVAEGLVGAPANGTALVRIHNTNTGKIVESRFEVRDGAPLEQGDFEIPGVSRGGAPIRLDFLDPGGATTGHLLPSGAARDHLAADGAEFAVSLVDAGNACVFLDAQDVGLHGGELPDELERPTVLSRLSAIREIASVAMGLALDAEAARARPMTPFVAVVAPPLESATLSGDVLRPEDMDLSLRVISNGQPHRAAPLTVCLCSAVAAAIPGSIVAAHASTSGAAAREGLRIGTPSGVIAAAAEVKLDDQGPHALRGAFFRTARRLLAGRVYG
jgi:2-methylaconitate cis-trans-isomerase PrpF